MWPVQWKGELVWWTSFSKLVDTWPFRALIIISIFSFIVCISCAMRNTPTSCSKRWLVSFWSRLLMALLSSWLSLSWWLFVGGRLLSRSSLPYLSFWLFGSWSFRYSNCRSNSWFCWLSCSTVAASVCTCLSNALGGFPVSWLVMAIDFFWTMQLLVFETVI